MHRVRIMTPLARLFVSPLVCLVLSCVATATLRSQASPQTAAPASPPASAPAPQTAAPAAEAGGGGPAAAPAPADYASEPFVIEQWHEQARFENDGTGRIERAVRIRVQSEEGVRAWGQLVADYNSSNERLDPPEVVVHKADGSTLPVDTSTAQDIALPVEMVAPTYTGYRQRHIAVPSLRPGDVLSFRVVRTIVQPVIPGQFWMEQDFVDGPIILDARLALDLPADRRVTIKVRPGVEELAGAQQPVAAPGRRLRAWRSSNLTTAAAAAAAAAAAKPGASAEADETAGDDDEIEPPAVRMSSFESWDEIARWYAGLVSAASEPDAAIKAKAEALTRDKKTPDDKLEALYAFVAQEVRYVSLSLGLNQYQPHKAADTLRDQYGDCKDKHTLLAALARAVGLTVEPALVHHLRKLDPDVPSPGQFDHVISVVATGADASAWTWLDTTPEVAPYRVLTSNLLGQTSLLARATASLPASAASAAAVPAGARGAIRSAPSAPAAGASATGAPASGVASSRALVEVPKRPAIEATVEMDTTGTLDDRGKLDVRVMNVFRGSVDLIWRGMLRSVPKSDWSKIGDAVQRASWIGGTVSEFTPGDPAATHEPLQVSYRLERVNFIDRTKSEFAMLLPLDRREFLFEQPADWANRTTPRDTGGPITSRFRAKIELPAAFTAQVPSNVELVRPYGSYKATYTLNGRTLTAERTFIFTALDIAPALGQDYLAFLRAIRADEAQTVRLTMPPAPAAPAETSTGMDDVHRAAWKAYQEGRFDDALALYTKVVEGGPKKTTAWNDRGLLLMAMRRLDEAAADFKQQIAINAFDPFAHNNLGRVYWQQRKYDEAAAEFRQQIAINPLDDFAHANLGQMANDRKRYTEAVPHLEQAVSIKPAVAQLRVMLGTAYLETKEPEKARASFDKAVELTPEPYIWNNVAYQMSLRGFDLDRAQQYAESAVGGLSIQMRLMALDALKPQHLAGVASFAAYWDTLGWIHFRRGDLPQADKYLHAAWRLYPRAELGRHLGEFYEKQDRIADALMVYAEALSLDDKDPDTRARLDALVSRHPDKVKALIAEARVPQSASMPPASTMLLEIGRARLVERRTVKLSTAGLAGKLPPADASGELFLLFDSASPSIAVKVVKGQELFAPLVPALQAATYPVSWPSDAPTKLVRRAVVACGAKGMCTVVLVPPGDVRSVD